MNKIPVGQTIRAAYAFTFGEIGTVIGLIWIPIVLNAVVSFMIEQYLRGQRAVLAPDQVPPGAGLVSLYYIAVPLIAAMIAVAITRQALGLRQGQAIAHVSIGPSELRVYAGFAGLFLLFFIFAMGIGLGAIVLAGLGSVLTPDKGLGLQIGAIAADIVALAGIAGLVYAMLRLSFLLVPSAVVEGTFGLSRSWELTKGNFWRIFAIVAATTLPISLLILAINLVVLGPEYWTAIAAMAADQAHAPKYMAQLVAIAEPKLPVLLGIGLVLAPVTNGLLFAPSAFAYRVLTGKSVLSA